MPRRRIEIAQDGARFIGDDGSFIRFAGESTDGIQRVKERQRDELRAVRIVAPEEECAPASRDIMQFGEDDIAKDRLIPIRLIAIRPAAPYAPDPVLRHCLSRLFCCIAVRPPNVNVVAALVVMITKGGNRFTQSSVLRHALPISTPATKTSAPPTTT
jgi:hypothetical protein